MLQKSLRFVGRYEFQGQGSVFEDKASGIQVFEALDYGAPSNPFDEGLPVFLRCYTNRPSFLAQVRVFTVSTKHSFTNMC